MRERSVLQLSGIVIDLIYRIDKHPEPGGEAEASEVLVAAGGGFNAMVAAKRFGLSVAYGGAMGTGRFAEIAERDLNEVGIPVLARRRQASDQGTCVVIVDRSGERTFYTHHGAERWPDHQDAHDIATAECDWVLLTGYSLLKETSSDVYLPLLDSLPQQARFVFDPSPLVANIRPDRLAAAMGRADWVSANRREASVLSGMEDARACAMWLAQRRSGALVRCGAEGCWLAVSGSAPVRIEGISVKAIDTSGAGDAHIGAFIGALDRGFKPEAAALVANHAAALKTTRFGPATAPGFQETLDFMKGRGVAMPI
jgi:sugar/nucleoside kinase (ribokinase family)